MATFTIQRRGPREIMPNSQEWYEKGREQMAAGRLAEAVASFRRSARLAPHFKTLELLGECLLRAGKTREAILPLAAATGLNRQPRAPMLLAEALFASGDYAAAVQAAEETLRRSPDNRRAASLLAKAVLQSSVRPD